VVFVALCRGLLLCSRRRDEATRSGGGCRTLPAFGRQGERLLALGETCDWRTLPAFGRQGEYLLALEET